MKAAFSFGNVQDSDVNINQYSKDSLISKVRNLRYSSLEVDLVSRTGGPDFAHVLNSPWVVLVI